MIMSEKFPPDCLFFIFEQDFELYPGGKILGADGSPTLPPTFAEPSASSSADPPPQGQKRKTGFERGQVKGRSSAADMVKIVNAASRKGVGDLVWLGYNPGSKNGGKSWTAPRVKFGTQLICLNVVAAMGIKMVMDLNFWKAEHIDMWLFKWCKDHRFSKGRCSYVFPPLGCFGAHTSECCPETGARGSLWDQVYTAVGTRPSEDQKGHRPKTVYGITEGDKGYVDLKIALAEEYFEGETGFWRTWVTLQKENTQNDSQLVARRRRREMNALKFRILAETPSKVVS